MVAPTDQTPLLNALEAGVIAEAATVEHVANHWRWILTLGVLNVIGGFFCLLSPIFASLFAETLIAVTLMAMGVASLLAVCMVDRSIKAYYGVAGVVQLLLGIVVFQNPFSTLAILTLILAVSVLVDGIYRTILVCNAPRISGWGLLMTSALASVLLGLLVLSAYPASSLYTIGILLGVNLITVGNVRIHLAWEGRELAST